MRKKISIITLGSYYSEDFMITLKKSYKIVNQLASEWIFVFMNEDEVNTFNFFRKEYPKYFKNIKIKSSYCSLGISKSMNIGIDLVEFDWILMLHSGDFFINDFLTIKKIKKLISSSKNVDIIVFGSIYYNKNNELGRSSHLNRNFLNKLPYEMSIPHQSTFVSKELYSKMNYSEDFSSAMDYDFFLRSKISGYKFLFSPYYLTIFSLGGKSSNLDVGLLEIKKSLKRNIKNRLLRFYLTRINLKLIILKKILFKAFYKDWNIKLK